MVKLEVGGAYKSRGGLRADVISHEFDGYSDHIPYFVQYSDGAEYYLSEDGRVWQGSESHRDLIAEWTDTPAEVIGSDAQSFSVETMSADVLDDLIAAYPSTNAPLAAPRSKYHRIIKGVEVDIYDILVSWGVTCPARQHAIKKLIMAGQRGAKGVVQDLDEAIQATERAKELVG